MCQGGYQCSQRIALKTNRKTHASQEQGRRPQHKAFGTKVHMVHTVRDTARGIPCLALHLRLYQILNNDRRLVRLK